MAALAFSSQGGAQQGQGLACTGGGLQQPNLPALQALQHLPHVVHLDILRVEGEVDTGPSHINPVELNCRLRLGFIHLKC